MKTICKKLAVPLNSMLLAILISCGGGAGGSDKEPNSTIEEAVPINLGEAFSISIDPQGDYDYFMVDVKEQGYLKVQASEVPDGITPEVTFALYEEWEGQKEKHLRNWNRLPDALHIIEPGTYYIVLHDDYDDQSVSENFQIKADFLPEFDDGEPNNTVENATENAFTEIKLAIYPHYDVDWYKVVAPGQGYITVMSNNVPEGINPEVYYAVYDEWADPKVQELRHWRNLPDACFVADSGDYYLLFHDDYDDAGSESLMDMKIQFLEEMDKYEPNNSQEFAKTVTKGDTLSIAIYPTGDYDYFKIRLGQNEKIKLMAIGYENFTPEVILQIINPSDPNEMMNISGWQQLPAEFEISAANEYYLLFHDDYDDAGSPKPFLVRIE